MKLLFVLWLFIGSAVFADDQWNTTVGMPGYIDQIVLPGTKLNVKPMDNTSASIVLRIIDSYPHGSAFRYDLVYYGLEPGQFDLKDYLIRSDVSSTDDLPAIRVTVRPTLPPGQVQPNRLHSRPTPRLGGYRVLAAAAGLAWVIGMFAILFAWRRGSAATHDEIQPRSLGDRLRPIISAAMTGTLSQTQQAELERLLLAYWRRRLNLENLRPSEAIAALRENEESAPVLRQLDIWLHRPGPREIVDVAALLRPYQELPADAI